MQSSLQYPRVSTSKQESEPGSGWVQGAVTSQLCNLLDVCFTDFNLSTDAHSKESYAANDLSTWVSCKNYFHTNLIPCEFGMG